MGEGGREGGRKRERRGGEGEREGQEQDTKLAPLLKLSLVLTLYRLAR